MLAADSERLFIGDILADDNSDYGVESDKASENSAGRVQAKQSKAGPDDVPRRDVEEHKEPGEARLSNAGGTGAQEIQSFMGKSEPRKGSRILSERQLLEEGEESSEPETAEPAVVANPPAIDGSFEP